MMNSIENNHMWKTQYESPFVEDSYSDYHFIQLIYQFNIHCYDKCSVCNIIRRINNDALNKVLNSFNNQEHVCGIIRSITNDDLIKTSPHFFKPEPKNSFIYMNSNGEGVDFMSCDEYNIYKFLK